MAFGMDKISENLNGKFGELVAKLDEILNELKALNAKGVVK